MGSFFLGNTAEGIINFRMKESIVRLSDRVDCNSLPLPNPPHSPPTATPPDSYNLLTSLSPLPPLPSLTSLTLLSNSLQSITSLLPLSTLNNLTSLTLQRKDGRDGNDVCGVEGYENNVLGCVCFLEVLDERITSDITTSSPTLKNNSPPTILDNVEDVNPMPKFEEMKERVKEGVELKRIERIEEQMRLLGALAQEQVSVVTGREGEEGAQ